MAIVDPWVWEKDWTSLNNSLQWWNALLDSGEPPRLKSEVQVDHQEAQIKPSWYNVKPDPIEYSLAHNLSFVEANIVKYVTRWKFKGGIVDLKKARECLNRLIAKVEAEK